jgi:hypothetical protein
MLRKGSLADCLVPQQHYLERLAQCLKLRLSS